MAVGELVPAAAVLEVTGLVVNDPVRTNRSAADLMADRWRGATPFVSCWLPKGGPPGRCG
jgi:hypothetical protein